MRWLGFLVLPILVVLIYLFITVWSVGWYKHDNSIKITMPDGTVYQYQLEKSK